MDLNPIGSTSSIAFAVQGDTQVGEAFVGGIYRASLWRGTAASWVDLNPQGAIESHAVALDAGSQAGWADFGSNPRAGVWSGTAASWIDLHAVLSQDFVLSKATGIWSDATHTYVVGWGSNAVTNKNEPLLWVGPALGPCDFDVGVVASRTVCPNRPASFTVTVSPSGPFTYQWRFNGVPITIQANSTARSATLRIRNALPVNVGLYDCVVTDSCRSVTSNAAELVVCSADFNCDGFLDFFDYDEFVTAFETGGGLEADFNRDGFVDFFDYDDFVLAYETGSVPLGIDSRRRRAASRMKAPSPQPGSSSRNCESFAFEA